MELSKAIEVNLGFIVNNWSKECTREKYNSLEHYINSNAHKYNDTLYFDKDISIYQIRDIIKEAFNNPIKLLNKELRTQYNIGQEKWFINEIKDAIKYYQFN
jgi:hypothetical protein